MTKRAFATRVFSADLASGDILQETVEAVARATSALRLPKIVRVHEAGVDGEQVFVVSEQVPDGSIQSYSPNFSSTRSLIPIAVAVDLVAQAADGLPFAHQRGIIHGDIRSDNLLLRFTPELNGISPLYRQD